VAIWVGLGVSWQGSIDNDVAEGVVDGSAWQLSYLRHPPLSSWLSGLASAAGPYRYAVLFSIALAFACAAFAVGAAFVRRLDGRAAGLVALMAGLGSPYAAYWPLKFNHNIGVMPFWALIILTAWQAFEGGSLAAWALFGVVVGLGLWAKYAILQLVGPLALLFFAVPEWRRKTRTAGPWIAGLICVAIIAPQLIDVAHKGATTLQWAIHRTGSDALQRLGWMVMFLFDAVLANLTLALIAWAACGWVPLLRAIRSMLARATRSRLGLFLHVVALGPVLVVIAAGPFGVRLFYHWVTPLAIGFALWWGHAAGRAGLRRVPRRAWLVYFVWAALVAVGYVGVWEFLARQSPLSTSGYAQMDGPALAKLAEDFWAAHGSGRIPYIVSYDGKVGFQAAGSIVFDLPYRVRAFKDGLTINAPWIDVADVRRSGALVVSGDPLAPHASLDGAEVEIRDVEAFSRPVMRGVKAPPKIYFGVIAPNS
jgi:4-amino-4-deoxy-L-arabinose transferase-like glycosyltransferase